MTDDRMALVELIEQGAESDLVREMLAFAAERMMDLEIEARTGAPAGSRSQARLNQQRCRVHWMRNALAHAAPKQRPAVIAMIKTIFAQETTEAAHQQWEQVADALRETFPKLADMMDASREDVLACMAFPKDHWAQIASTNPSGKGEQGDQTKSRRHRHLSQRHRSHTPRRRADARAE
jgi:hypothetical protein